MKDRLKRIQLFEFEDQPWFPNWLRECMTRFIVAMHKLLGSSEDLASLIARTVKQTKQTTILDLCSGSGGPMLSVVKVLREKYGFKNIELVLSDLYPHRKTARMINNMNDPQLSYLSTSLHAATIGNKKGIRTLVGSLHHMQPETAKGILKAAMEAQQPIIVFEISDNSFPRWLWWSVMPFNFLMTLFVTPLVRPMTWHQLVFTYPIPILPLLIAWDGAVSNARTYTLKDLDILLADLKSMDYGWETGVIKSNGGSKLYLMGTPIIHN